ncbi:MAG: response regulator transcription factor [Thermodesulfobacteriota bacterium]|nr:response regulator transcription factor [Thermodesulfobacteriota bacterium]
MENNRVLIAEDDGNILAGLVDTLESEGYKVSPAHDGEQALSLFKNNTFDLVLIDIMMPGKNGYDVCREIRTLDDNIAIILLTAKGEEIDKVVGLQIGADDYITKPFGVHELIARITAVLRRSKRNPDGLKKEKLQTPKCFAFGDAIIDVRQFRLTKEGKVIDLSERELRLLQLFFLHPNEVLSREQLLNNVWGIDYYGTTRTLDQHIAQLRKKVETDPAKPRFIKTVHGIGYRYEND